MIKERWEKEKKTASVVWVCSPADPANAKKPERRDYWLGQREYFERVFSWSYDAVSPSSADLIHYVHQIILFSSRVRHQTQLYNYVLLKKISGGWWKLKLTWAKTFAVIQLLFGRYIIQHVFYRIFSFMFNLCQMSSQGRISNLFDGTSAK